MLNLNILNPATKGNEIRGPAVTVNDAGTGLGRGAFTSRSYSKGQIVEICPVILLDYPMRELPTPVQQIAFNWNKLCDAPENYALVLGYGSIYNHADDPNLGYSADPENQVMIYTAMRKIEKGEQLTVSYNQVPEGSESRKKDWFEIHKVEKILIKERSNGR